MKRSPTNCVRSSSILLSTRFNYAPKLPTCAVCKCKESIDLVKLELLQEGKMRAFQILAPYGVGLDLKRLKTAD